jgi:hypothetical protein
MWLACAEHIPAIVHRPSGLRFPMVTQSRLQAVHGLHRVPSLCLGAILLLVGFNDLSFAGFDGCGDKWGVKLLAKKHYGLDWAVSIDN